MKYVLAISGGVDSVVLLDMIATDYHGFRRDNFPESIWPDDFIVAHFEHGVRGVESKKDAEFVRNLAERYGTRFTLGEGNLSSNCSEEIAREKRYKFLYSINGEYIVTAHHQDDLIETILINLIRGTGWRGLAPMNNAKILRPLLNLSKVEIVKFAVERNLTWREDATNDSMRYFRNRVREFIVRWPDDKRRELLELYKNQDRLREEINHEVKKCLNPSRYFLIMIPESVALEILRAATFNKLTRPELKRVLLFAKTALPRKKIFFKNVKISAKLREIIIESN